MVFSQTEKWSQRKNENEEKGPKEKKVQHIIQQRPVRKRKKVEEGLIKKESW